MEQWFEFRAYNSQAAHAYGTEREADLYCDVLNRGRDVNCYGYRAMHDTETDGLDSGADTDGFRLDLALDAQAEIDAENEKHA